MAPPRRRNSRNDKVLTMEDLSEESKFILNHIETRIKDIIKSELQPILASINGEIENLKNKINTLETRLQKSEELLDKADAYG